MTRRVLQFFHRYNEDGSCKVICLDCYATLGTASDRDEVAQLEAAHSCGEWKRAAETAVNAAENTLPHRRRLLHPTESMLSGPERVLARLNPVILVLLIAVVLYFAPTALEIAARSHVNTWLAVILPGDLAGCLVLGWLAKMPRVAVALYLLLTACECWWHVARVMQGVTMAWFADLVPTLIVMGIVLIRLQRAREGSAFA